MGNKNVLKRVISGIVNVDYNIANYSNQVGDDTEDVLIYVSVDNNLIPVIVSREWLDKNIQQIAMLIIINAKTYSLCTNVKNVCSYDATGTYRNEAFNSVSLFTLVDLNTKIIDYVLSLYDKIA